MMAMDSEQIGKSPTGDGDNPTGWDARLVHIFISNGHDYWGRRGAGRMSHGIQSVERVECVEGCGLRGDRYFNERPDAKGQVTFFDVAVFDAIRERFKLPALPASIFRRNLVVAGVNLRAWKGKRFSLQGVEFEGSQECKPCDWMDRTIADGAQEFLRAEFRGGLRAKVRSSGVLTIDGSS